jgi:hypothetical protein
MILVGKSEGKISLGRHSVSKRIILTRLSHESTFNFFKIRKVDKIKWILKNSVQGCGLNSSTFGKSPVADSFEHGSQPSGFIRGQEFIDHLSEYRINFPRGTLFNGITCFIYSLWLWRSLTTSPCIGFTGGLLLC